jgi:hypothetical protein
LGRWFDVDFGNEGALAGVEERCCQLAGQDRFLDRVVPLLAATASARAPTPKCAPADGQSLA